MSERLPRVALVDFQLRDGDSSGLVAEVRNKGVPVIILSGCCMTKVVGNNSEITLQALIGAYIQQ